ncbi:DUF4440 domain-containing protein [Paenibacillus rhizovicinus]|uniref:DUF4440 domain-containing protein n=1 Tax=Paenibacillus rhizovicinus TaxID=2704463 RepID=A0A6C0P9W6_9BACL|nr:DUF4440 domain-containing protein [Paenibacillus rhizovicinus]QHW35279.1 DUF4440 domain-containing protein [Paenibacillus rhizovicinus]
MISMDSIRQELLELEELLLQPEVRTSVTALSKLLADDFFEFGSSGKIWSRRDALDPNGIGVVKMELSDFQIHPLSEGVTLSTYKILNKENMQYSLRSSIWKYENAKWQMIFHQGTPIV